jgi:hypothetical protein
MRPVDVVYWSGYESKLDVLMRACGMHGDIDDAATKVGFSTTSLEEDFAALRCE